MPPVPPNPFYAQQPTNVNSLEIVSGNVGIGTSSPTEKLTVSGNVAVYGDIYSSGQKVAVIIDPVRTTVTGNGSIYEYEISGANNLINPSALIVAIDGILQEPNVDYAVSSGNITFTSPLPSGSKAVVISPTNSLQVGQIIPSDGSVTSVKLAPNLTLLNTTFDGETAFISTSRPTSSATGLPSSNDLITMLDGDGRYGNFLISDLIADGTPIQSQTTLQNTGCQLTLGVGTWLIQAQTHVTNANTAAQLKFAATITGGTEAYGSVMWGIGNSGVPGHDNIQWLTATRTLGNTVRGWWKVEGLIRVISGTATIRTQYAQNVSTAADTIVRTGTHIIARRLKS
jgi:hypothetical protein